MQQQHSLHKAETNTNILTQLASLYLHSALWKRVLSISRLKTGCSKATEPSLCCKYTMLMSPVIFTNNIDFRCAPHEMQCLQLNLSPREEPIGALSKLKIEEHLFLSFSEDPPVSQIKLLPKQAHLPCCLHQGARIRCQQIWQAIPDIFIRASTPSKSGTKVSWGITSSMQLSS